MKKLQCCVKDGRARGTYGGASACFLNNDGVDRLSGRSSYGVQVVTLELELESTGTAIVEVHVLIVYMLSDSRLASRTVDMRRG